MKCGNDHNATNQLCAWKLERLVHGTGLDEVLEYLLLDIYSTLDKPLESLARVQRKSFRTGRTRVRGTKHKVLEYKYISFVFVTIVLAPWPHFSHITVKTSQARPLLVPQSRPVTSNTQGGSTGGE